MANKTYKVETRFIFEGYFTVKATSKAEAKELIENETWMAAQNMIGVSNRADEKTTDWDFDMKPQKKIVSVKLEK